MDDTALMVGGGISVFIAIIAVILVVLWMVMPVMVYSINKRMDKVIELLDAIRAQLVVANDPEAGKELAIAPSNLKLLNKRYTFSCPHCGAQLSTENTTLNRVVECASCGGKIYLPQE